MTDVNTTTIPPSMRPRPMRNPPADPNRVVVDIRAESPTMAIPARSPKIPIKMAKMASKVTPVGLGGICASMSDG